MRMGMGMGMGELYLPGPVIHVIQSFLTSKQAAQSTLLSPSWRSAWLTRPNLDLDQTDKYYGHGRRSHIDTKQFSELADKTLQRYEDLNLKIESFRLCMKVPDYYSSAPATELVLRALKLGPTRLAFEFQGWDAVLPEEVFVSENLVSLTGKHCKINLDREVIGCLRLQSLCLDCVRINSRDALFHILSSCPLIEKLSLRYVTVVGGSKSGSVDVGDDGLQAINLHRLRSLAVDDLGFDTTLFLGDLSSKFPSLKDLAMCVLVRESQETILISSHSLECLHFRMERNSSRSDYTAPRVKFHVPRIRKLTFEGATIPKLSITSSSRGSWESHLILRRGKCLSPSWFRKLNIFLKKFRRSTLKSLTLHPSPKTSFDYEPGDNIMPSSPMPEIENLNIYLDNLPSLSCYALFDGLFRVCRPKVITQYNCIEYSCSYHLLEKTSNIHFLGKRLLDARDSEVLLTPNQFMYSLNELKEARAQVFDEADSTWRDVPLEPSSYDEDPHNVSYDETFDALTTKSNPIIRFQLNWQTRAA